MTLVEVVLVIGLIAVLVGLLLPAVQASRESARRVGCMSKQKQIVQAIYQFHDGHKAFPPGRFSGPYGIGSSSTAWSWMAQLLPFLEQGALFDRGGLPGTSILSSHIADTPLLVFVCPSGMGLRSVRLDAGNLVGVPVGVTTYKGVSGSNWGEDASTGGAFYTAWMNKGVNGSFDGLGLGDGILWREDYKVRLGFHSVDDGLSNTFIVGEDLPDLNAWCSWPYANNAYGTCAIPPNLHSADPNEWRETWSFRSRHPNGLLFAFADGSVKFIANEIELKCYRTLSTRSGGDVASLIN